MEGSDIKKAEGLTRRVFKIHHPMGKKHTKKQYDLIGGKLLICTLKQALTISEGLHKTQLKWLSQDSGLTIGGGWKLSFQFIFYFIIMYPKHLDISQAHRGCLICIF